MALYLDRRRCLLRLFPLDLACRITQYLHAAPRSLRDSLPALQKSGTTLLHWMYNTRNTKQTTFALRQCEQCHELVWMELRTSYNAAGYAFRCRCSAQEDLCLGRQIPYQ